MPDDDVSAAMGACPTCGREVPEDARFCVGCGAARSDGATSAEQDATTVLATTSAAPVGAVRTGGSGSPPGGAGMRPCPSCRIANHETRMLCAGCGQDLLEPGPGSPVVAQVDRERGPAGRRPVRLTWLLPLAAIAAVVLVVVAVLAVLEVGPFATVDPLPEAAFEPDRYPDEPQVLELSDVATLTERPAADDRTFAATNLVDNNPFTAWMGDASQLPVDTEEKLDLFLSEPAWVDAVVLANGDHLAPDAYEAAGRIQRGVLVFDGDVQVPVTLLDQGLEPQIVELEEPLLTETVRLEIVDTFPGVALADPAVSRIELRGHLADEADAEVAAQRRAQRPAAGVIAVASGER
ncbi:MAG: zinc ribbon domain-containing protein [Nitriliruptoraceae bacterium]|nr:zinc ribbon domain-containing protein [Nitriliruptoraceae bacterium]